jgi:leader peptidase (prepilin peptidase) / N-methyltransferase
VTASWIALWAVLGALIGSFGNVVVYRWPLGLSVVRPRSRCPSCGHTLGPLDLVPILSWLALRGRCRSCRAPISPRYPLVEAGMAAGFGLLAWAYPVTQGATVVPLVTLWAVLLIAALIDLDTYLLPDGLTLPALAVGLGGAFLYDPAAGLPTPLEALLGATVAAGVLALVNRIGGLALRRFADTRERLAPVSLDTVNVAALAGLVAGWPVALAAGGLQILASALLRRSVRVAEPALYGAWLLALVAVAAGVAEAWGVDLVAGLTGTAVGAGAFALLGAIWWWVADLRTPAAAAAPQRSTAGSVAASGLPPTAASGLPLADDEPVAMGFGDVKLAGVLGAMLGWQGFLVALLLAVLLGAVIGVIARSLGGSRFVPFGPFLVAGAFLALAVGDGLVRWYLALLGV